MDHVEIARLGVARLAAAYSEKKLTPLDALAAYEKRIRLYNPQLSAFLDLRLDEARDEAAASTDRWRKGEPLSDIDGVPYGVKANIAVTGLPWHGGIGAYRDRKASADADVVVNLANAGAISLGILNMHEGALGATTDNPFFGRCCNPWDINRTPGGSSGGSGSAVAAGLCAFALGTDTMGSVRIPSAYCGITGIKPTYGFVPCGGLVDLSPTLDHIGVHAFSIEDLVMALPLMSGKALDKKAHLDRIGVARWGEAVDVDGDVADAFDKTVALLEHNFDLYEVDLSGLPFGGLRRRGLLISEVEGEKAHHKMLEENPLGFSRDFRVLLEWGASQPKAKIDAAYADIRAAGEQFKTLLKDIDVLVLPTTPQGPFRFEEEAPVNQADFTAIANMAGCPAVAVPSSTDGAPPASIQFIARPGSDHLALYAAAQFEAKRGPAPRPPAYF